MITTLIPRTQELTDFLAMPEGVVKNLMYFNKMQYTQNIESSFYEKETSKHYCSATIVVKKNKNAYYTKVKSKEGFTIDEKGKLSIWFGKNIISLNLTDLYKHYNFNWLSPHLHSYITKTIAEKIFAGKITNELDVVRAYCKSMRWKDIDYSLLLECMKKDLKNSILMHAQVAVNINHALKFVLNIFDDKRINTITDMIQQAQILSKTIDYSWSLKRLEKEHKSWTKEIMETEMGALDTESIPGIEKYESKQNGFTLLRSQKEVFQEAKMQSHCLYSSYWSNIKNNNYVAYSLELNGERATLGVNIHDSKMFFGQCTGKYNATISTKVEEIAKTFINKFNKKQLK